MIISFDQSPWYSVYYIGSIVLDIVKSEGVQCIDILDLYVKINKKRKVSLSLLIKSLVFLYSIGVVREVNGVELCF